MTDNDAVAAAALNSVAGAAGPIWYEGLDRNSSSKFDAAQMKTAWGRLHQSRCALMDGEDLLASAVQYDLGGSVDGRSVRIWGIGSILVAAAHRGRGHARALLERQIAQAARRGADMALLFAGADLEDGMLDGFAALVFTDLTLDVAESPRKGAPMTMVRAGEERDLAAIAAMGRVRADAYRFHLDRDVDLIQYAITRQRLRAGLAPAGARQLQFFIAEEGTTAAAYVVLSVVGDTWTLEECGDRDPSGARVGALLQALVAREPAERRPTIHGWLPADFLPPQVTIASSAAAPEIMRVRWLNEARPEPTLSRADLLYWRNDVF
jgi:GNAT superfamily N-acetyltransferase